jgi:hypothetical protein
MRSRVRSANFKGLVLGLLAQLRPLGQDQVDRVGHQDRDDDGGDGHGRARLQAVEAETHLSDQD